MITLLMVWLTIVGLVSAYFASAVLSVIIAFLLQFLFPAVMKIIEIPWPTWVYANADKFTSWFILIFTFRLIIGSFIPINSKIQKTEKTDKRIRG